MTLMPLRVLAADDDPTARLLLQAALGGGDFALTLVDNGSDALTSFQQSVFDIAAVTKNFSIALSSFRPVTLSNR